MFFLLSHIHSSLYNVILFLLFPIQGSTEGDDVSAIARELFKVDNYLKSSHDILDNYREFCKRVSL